MQMCWWHAIDSILLVSPLKEDNLSYDWRLSGLITNSVVTLFRLDLQKRFPNNQSYGKHCDFTLRGLYFKTFPSKIHLVLSLFTVWKLVIHTSMNCYFLQPLHCYNIKHSYKKHQFYSVMICRENPSTSSFILGIISENAYCYLRPYFSRLPH